MRDAIGFDEFYRTTSPRILRYAYAVTGDHAEAQDLAQEAFARAWRQWHHLSSHPAPEAWARLVVSRLAADRWRRIRGWRAAVHRSGRPEDVRPPNEETVLLVAALRQLLHAHRQALALHYLCDLSVEDIARETGVAPGTVKSWLSRGRSRLATLLPDLSAGLVEVNRGRGRRSGRRHGRRRTGRPYRARLIAASAVRNPDGARDWPSEPHPDVDADRYAVDHHTVAWPVVSVADGTGGPRRATSAKEHSGPGVLRAAGKHEEGGATVHRQRKHVARAVCRVVSGRSVAVGPAYSLSDLQAAQFAGRRHLRTGRHLPPHNHQLSERHGCYLDGPAAGRGRGLS